MSRARPANRTDLLVIGRIAAALSLVLCVLLQWLDHDFFPPKVSISQYGIGPHGWIFTLWSALVALAVLALQAGRTVRRRHVSHWLMAGAAGLVVMGNVRTDANGLQQSVHGSVHMLASIVALVALPIGMTLAISPSNSGWRKVSWMIVGLSALSLALVLLSAVGCATAGLDARRSWSLWQSVAVTSDMLLLAVFAVNSSAPRRDLTRAPSGATRFR